MYGGMVCHSHHGKSDGYPLVCVASMTFTPSLMRSPVAVHTPPNSPLRRQPIGPHPSWSQGGSFMGEFGCLESLGFLPFAYPLFTVGSSEFNHHIICVGGGRTCVKSPKWTIYRHHKFIR